MRLIDADAICYTTAPIVPTTQGEQEHYVTIAFKKDIDEVPTVDAVPIERDIPKAPIDQQLEEDGYGAWGSLYGTCPNCRGSVYEEQNYCERCGQRLDWRKDNEVG